MMSELTFQPMDTAPSSGLILLRVGDGEGEFRTFPAEASFNDQGFSCWMITTGWVGYTRLHSAWKPVGWMTLPDS